MREETYFDKLISESEIRKIRLFKMSTIKKNKSTLVGKTIDELKLLCESHGYDNYRGEQLFNWIYKNYAIEFNSMINIPKKILNDIKDNYDLHSLKYISSTESDIEKTNKILFKTNSGALIESVVMYEGNRVTLCISTQVGCALDCKFCATAKMGFKENLTCSQIIDQYLQISSIIKYKITNVVFMGMGEPFLNYTNVIKAANLLHDDKGINLGYNRITISTAGIIKNIIKFSIEKQKFNLAISLNATSNEKRLEIMPITKNNTLDDLMKASNLYASSVNKRLTFEYVLLKDINDDSNDASRLIKLLSSVNKCKLNIIPYNYIGDVFERPDDEKIEKFLKILEGAPFPVTVRWSKGTDISAGCGQLAVSEK